MGVIWTSRTRTKQPQGVSGKPSPMFRPRILATPSSQFESVGGRLREVSGGYSIGMGPEGVATICPTTQIPGFVAYTVAAPVSITGDYSLLVYASASGNSSGLETHTIDHGGALALTAFQFSNTSIVGFLDGNTTGSISGVFTQPTVAIAVRRGNTAWLYVGNQSSSSVTGTRAGEPTGLVIGRDRVSNDPAGGVKTYLYALFDYGLSAPEIASLIKNPWQLFAPERRPVFFSLPSGTNNTGALSSTLDAATLTGVGNVTRSGTLAVTLDAATLAGIGTAAVTNKTGTLAVTLDAATLAGVGAVTRSGTLAVTLDAATLAGVGSVAVGSNREGTLASTLADATLAGIGGVARSATLAVTLDAATLAGVGTAGQPRTGTLAVTLDNATLSGVGAIPAAPSTGGGKTTGSNLSRKQKKKLKAVESQEWLKAEETARQLLSDRFTKQTPQEKAQALETHIESLVPVIEALKAITDQIEDVQETVQETKTEELTEHKQILNKFDALITKMTSIEELLIIMLAQ